jgi:HEAT repeat protein
VLSCLCACASSSKDEDSKELKSDNDPLPFAEQAEKNRKVEPIGKYLADLDTSMRAWTRLHMTAATPDERKKARLLEMNLATRAHARRGEIIEQLQTGPLANRVVAASALGFSRDAEAHAPLLAALEDSSQDVVANALLGLMLLGRSDTPLERICDLARTSSDAGVRTNAIQCLAALVQNGAQSKCAISTGRLGLSDPEPPVRAHSALLLGELEDTESVQVLLDTVQDAVPLVASAALQSVVWIGRQQGSVKGKIARALLEFHESARSSQKNSYRRALVELAGVDYGNDTKEWAEWATRLP